MGNWREGGGGGGVTVIHRPRAFDGRSCFCWTWSSLLQYDVWKSPCAAPIAVEIDYFHICLLVFLKDFSLKYPFSTWKSKNIPRPYIDSVEEPSVLVFLCIQKWEKKCQLLPNKIWFGAFYWITQTEWLFNFVRSVVKGCRCLNPAGFTIVLHGLLLLKLIKYFDTEEKGTTPPFVVNENVCACWARYGFGGLESRTGYTM